jgi:hypothetical protein
VEDILNHFQHLFPCNLGIALNRTMIYQPLPELGIVPSRPDSVLGAVMIALQLFKESIAVLLEIRLDYMMRKKPLMLKR